MTRRRDIRSALTVTTAPACEPVSRAEAKWQMRVDHADEDQLIDGYVAAARRQVEQDTGRTLVNTVYTYTLDAFPEERWIALPRWPLSTVGSITSYAEDDSASTLSSGTYLVDTTQARVCLNDGEVWPSDLREFNAGAVQFTAGGNGDAVSVSSVVSSGTAPTVTATATASSHGFDTGDWVTIAGADQDGYNGTFRVTVTGASTFTYRVVSGTPDSPATGTITARELHAPGTLRAAILLLATMLWERRAAVELVPAGMTFREWPLGYAALIGGADRQYAMA